MGFEFPSQLKEFWRDIGYGSLYKSKNGENPGLNNQIMPPIAIEDIMLKTEDALILPDIAEELHPGDMPFFHIGDSSSFLVMRPQSDNPNAVYDQYGYFVEKDFETFIYRLYHESPLYYNIAYIEEKNNEKK